MIYATGSKGFIGKHLLKALKEDVVCIPHDEITSVKLKSFDFFYFLSTYGNMYHHKENGKIFQANVVDLVSVLKQISKINFKSFIYMSTSSVKLRTQTMYSRSKKAAEEILLSYMEKYKAPICIIRPFSVTGVGEQKEHLIPTLIRSCMTGELVNFDPKATHDWIDVSDVVDGILNLSNHSAKGIFELGTGSQYTNQEVLNIVQMITEKKANINVVERLRDYDNENWVSTNFKARGYGWLPGKSLDTTIKEMVEAYESS